MTDHSPAGAGIGGRPPLPVYLEVWGATRADAQAAAHAARYGPARGGWGFDDERTVIHEGGVCRLKLEDPKALAAAQGLGWAYVVRLAAAPAGGEPAC